MKQLTEDEFDEQFTVIPDDQGETIRPTADGIDTESKHLWTIVDAEGSLYAVSGWHFVNRIGYILTEEAWTEETEAVWYEFNDEDEEEES
jgi:hypothetical protein